MDLVHPVTGRGLDLQPVIACSFDQIPMSTDESAFAEEGTTFVFWRPFWSLGDLPPTRPVQAWELLLESDSEDSGSDTDHFLGRFDFLHEGISANEVDDFCDAFSLPLEPLYLYHYSRPSDALRVALLEGPELRGIREKMREAGCSCTLEPSGAKLFYDPQYASVMESALAQYDGRLFSSHVVVQRSLVPTLHDAIASIPRKQKVKQEGDSTALVNPNHRSLASSPSCWTWLLSCVESLKDRSLF